MTVTVWLQVMCIWTGLNIIYTNRELARLDKKKKKLAEDQGNNEIG